MARYRRARSYARRAFRTRTYRKSGFGAAFNMQFLIGAVASFLPINLPPIANTAITGIAVAPIKLPGGIKMGCQGYVLGKLIQQFTGNPLNAVGSTSSNGWF